MPDRQPTTAEQVYRGTTRILAAVILVIGIAMVILTLVRGGGVTAIGVWFGVVFAALGCGRLYLSYRP